MVESHGESLHRRAVYMSLLDFALTCIAPLVHRRTLWLTGRHEMLQKTEPQVLNRGLG